MRIVYLIGRIDRGLRGRLASTLEQHGLSVAEFTAMSVLLRRPSLSNAQIARRSLITPQSTIQVIAELERRGLLVRDADPAHRRILLAALTAEGKRLVLKAESSVAILEETLLAEVAEPDRELVRQCLLSVMRRLQDDQTTAEDALSTAG